MSCNNPSGRGCINPIACSHDGFCEFPSPRLTEAIAKTCKRIEEAGAGSTKVAAKLKANPTDPAAVEQAARDLAGAIYLQLGGNPHVLKRYRDGEFDAEPEVEMIQAYGDQREADAGKPANARWSLGATVQKKRGSSWRGTVVGFYSTAHTPIGYCVDSAFEPGSVQVWPEAALEDWNGDQREADARADERVRVVAWLTATAESHTATNLEAFQVIGEGLRMAAGEIERGDHMKGSGGE